MEKKKFRLLDPMRDGRGVEKGEDTTPNLKYFFKLWGRKFWKLISVNLLLLVQILPLLLCLLIQLAGPKEPVQSDPLYATLLGAQTASPTSAGATIFNVFAGLNYTIDTYNSPVRWIIVALLVFHVLTYGWQKVGSAYLMRNLVRGDGVFIVSDFFYAIKRNLKQGFLLGLLDCICVATLVIDFMYFASMPVSGFYNFMYFAIFAIILIYMVMRFYMYNILVTFNIKFTKILKNSFIFVFLGLKRNLMAILGIALLAALAVALFVVLYQFNFIVGVAIILPFLYFLAFAAFMYTYAAYPVIKKYMIDPVPTKEKNPEENSVFDEA